MDRPKVSGLLLAGGKSRRMGRDKTALPCGKTDFFINALSVLKKTLLLLYPEQPQQIYVSCRAEQIPDFEARLIRGEQRGTEHFSIDFIVDSGIGILNALEICLTSPSLVIPCDCPFLTAELLAELVRERNRQWRADLCATVFCEAETGRLQPLIGVYEPAARPWLRKADEENIPLRRALPTSGVCLVPCAEKMAQLVNINTPEDRARAGLALDDAE